jgi:hypothetical protein
LKAHLADGSGERFAVQKRAPQATVFCNGLFDSTPESLTVALIKIFDRVFRKALLLLREPKAAQAESCPNYCSS